MSNSPEDVSRIAKKLQEAKLQDEKFQKESESLQPSPKNNPRKKLLEAISNDVSIGENVSKIRQIYILTNIYHFQARI